MWNTSISWWNRWKSESECITKWTWFYMYLLVLCIHSFWNIVINNSMLRLLNGPLMLRNELMYNVHLLRSSEISQKSNIWHFQYFIFMFYSFKCQHFAENLIWMDQLFQSYDLLNGFQNKNKRKSCLYLPVSIAKPVSPTSDWFR